LNVQKYHRKTGLGNRGFTLIEILIVVMVLGILAMIIIPQINVSTEDAKQSTLATNISGLRNAIELYYHQHKQIYPGGGTVPTGETAATAFLRQLTEYTDIDGNIATIKDGTTYKYGPYLKGGSLPENPFNNLSDVACNTTVDIITTRVSTGDTGWLFYTITGNLMANDGEHDDL